MATTIAREDVESMYEQVRSDSSDVNWMVLKFHGTEIIVHSSGTDFTEFEQQFEDHERAFGYVRIQTGDELSKRCKFVLVTWCGPDVTTLKRARMSTDKSIVKEVLRSFAVELQAESLQELHYDTILDLVIKAGGAIYGTGNRE